MKINEFFEKFYNNQDIIRNNCSDKIIIMDIVYIDYLHLLYKNNNALELKLENNEVIKKWQKILL